MSGGGFQVQPEQLSTHASTVAGVAGSVHQAAEAAGIERGGGLVYGVLIDPLVWIALNPWADHIRDLIDENASTGDTITALRNNAELYGTVETTNTTTITKAGPW